MSLDIMKLIMKILSHPIFRRHRRKRRMGPDSVTKIPQEVMDMILTHLKADDQICLALTCKPLFYSFQLFLRDKKIELRQLFASPRRGTIYRKDELKYHQPRKEFLHRLEDRRWRYCAQCWNLHRHSAWHWYWYWPWPWSLLHYPKYSKKSNPTTTPLRSLCTPYAKTKDICPCLTITLPDKLHVIGMIKTKVAEDRVSTTRTKFYNGTLYYLAGCRQPSLAHVCRFKAHPLAALRITSTLIWNEKMGRLLVQSTYHFGNSRVFNKHLSRESSNYGYPVRVQYLPVGFKTVLMCPHKSPKRWLNQFFIEAGTTSEPSKFSGLYASICSIRTSRCYCAGSTDRSRSYQDLYIHVERDLGGNVLAW